VFGSSTTITGDEDVEAFVGGDKAETVRVLVLLLLRGEVVFWVGMLVMEQAFGACQSCRTT